MDEEIEIGGFSMKGKRRLSEDLVETIDVEEVQSKIGAFVSKVPVPELDPAPIPKRQRTNSFSEDQKPKAAAPVETEKYSDSDSYKKTPPSESDEEVLETPVRPRRGGRR